MNLTNSMLCLPLKFLNDIYVYVPLIYSAIKSSNHYSNKINFGVNNLIKLKAKLHPALKVIH